MAKYHLKDDGTPGVCRAKPGNCPKAPDSEHFGSQEEARAAYEKNMEKALLERFNKFPNPSYSDAEFKERVARKRRVEDAVLNADPRKTVIRADYRDMPRYWDGRERVGFFVHPEFRAALPDDKDFAVYVETVQLEDSLKPSERASAEVDYDPTTGVFIYSYIEERDRGPEFDAGYDY